MSLSMMSWFLFAFLLCGKWNLSSLTRDGTRSPAVEARILNHSTTTEVPA